MSPDKYVNGHTIYVCLSIFGATSAARCTKT